MEPEAFVEAAHAVALQIERHVPIAERLQRPHHRRAHLWIERARHLVPRDLDARHLVMVPDAVHAESEQADGLFRQFDRAELLDGDLGVIWNARQRHADAGSFQVGSPRRDSSRISSFPRFTSSSGLRTPNSRAA